jgi:hypothetical protein
MEMDGEGIMSNANKRRQHNAARQAYQEEARLERALQSVADNSASARTTWITLAQSRQRDGYWELSNTFLWLALNCGLRRGERDEVRRSIANNMKQARLDLARGA